MINNLLSAIRDNKTAQLVQGATSNGSGSKKESKGGFGLIFQTLQGEGANEDGKNQQTLAGQTETTEGDTLASETKAENKDLAKEPSASILSKIQMSTEETVQDPEADETQTEEKKEVVVIESEPQLISTTDEESQSKSDTIITQEVAKEISNVGKASSQTNDQSELNISSTDGILTSEKSEETSVIEKVIVEGKSSELIKDTKTVNAEVKNENVISAVGDQKQEIPVIESGKVVNLQETVSARVSNPVKTGKHHQEIVNSETGNAQKAAEEKVALNLNQELSAQQEANDDQHIAKNTPGIGKTEILTGDNEVKQDGIVQEQGQPQDQNTTTTQSQIPVNQDQSSGVFRPQNDQNSEKKTEELQETAKPNLSEPLKTGVKIDDPLTAKNEPQVASNEEPAVHPRSEITVKQDQEGVRVVGTLKEDPVRRPVLTIAESEKNQNANSVSNSVSVSEENQQKLVQDLMINKESSYPLENGSVIEKIHEKDIREKKYGDRSSGFENRGEVKSEREKLISDWRSSQLWSEKVNAFTGGQSQPNHSFLSQETTIGEDDLPWNKHSMDMSQLKENKAAEQQAMSFSRLMEIPVFNFSVRRNLMPALTQTILKASSGNSTLNENWQKHNFSLENGKSLQLSMRQVDGIVYLKLNSSHNELTRLLVQHQNEIREHLQRECNLEVDLQFEDNGDQDLSQFFDDSSSSRKRGWSEKSVLTSGRGFSERETQDVQKTIRKFGYNRMEWMA